MSLETKIIFTQSNFIDTVFWIIICAIFWVSILRTTFHRRYILDFWSYTLTLQLLIPFILKYWFAGSLLNMMSVGPAVYLIQKALPQAFLVSFTGMVFFFIGAYFWCHPILWVMRKPIEKISGKMYSIFVNRSKGRVYAIIMLALSVLISGYVISKIGFGFKARNVSLQDNSFRPLLNLNLAFLLPVSTLILTARAVAYRKPMDIILGVCSLPLIALTGTKSAVLSPIVTLMVLYAATSKFSIKKAILLISGFCGFIVVIPILNALRDGGGAANPLIELLYGNAFSDLRDFAWFLSYWNGNLYLGMTYIAGFLSFLPRSISPFREQFAYGVVTATTVGFSPLSHAGLRIGLFGEPYINFGWLGVAMAGLFMGISIRFLHNWIYGAERVEERILRFAVSIYIGEQIFKIGNSSAFFALYGFFCLLIGNEIFCRVSQKIRQQRLQYITFNK